MRKSFANYLMLRKCENGFIYSFIQFRRLVKAGPVFSDIHVRQKRFANISHPKPTRLLFFESRFYAFEV